MLIRNLIAISGIFSKDADDLDILPPPPPFPKIGGEEKELQEAERERKRQERKKKKELEQGKREEARKIKERQKKLQEKDKQKVWVRKKKEREKLKKEKLKRKKEIETKKREEIAKRQKRKEEQKKKRIIARDKRKKERKQKTFEFFNNLGLVKTEEEKEAYRKKREERKKLREISKKMKLEETKKGKPEKLKEVKKKPTFGGVLGKGELSKELKDLEKIIPKEVKETKFKKVEIKELEIKKSKEEKKKATILEKFFGKRKDEDLSKELEDLERIKLNLKKGGELRSKAKKLEVTEVSLRQGIKEPDAKVKSEEEIRKAIQTVKGLKKKKPSVFGRVFGKKEVPEEKVETPGVMPRIIEKTDVMEEIDENIHKARLVLMNFKFAEAKKIYIEVIRIYNNLDPKKQAKVYQEIRDLYFERKSAEKFEK